MIEVVYMGEEEYAVRKNGLFLFPKTFPSRYDAIMALQYNYPDDYDRLMADFRYVQSLK